MGDAGRFAAVRSVSLFTASFVTAGADGVEELFPGFWSAERDVETVFADVGIFGDQVVGAGSEIRLAVAEEDVAFAAREKLGRFIGGGDAQNDGVIAKCAVVEFGEIANAFLQAGADGQGPQNAVLAKREFAEFGFDDETLNVLVAGSGEKEKFIEVALASHFRVARGKAGILHEFARREAAERNGFDAGIFGETGKSFLRSGLRLRDGHAGETAEAKGFFRAEMKIIFGEKNGAAAFSDEGMSMAHFAAGIVHLQARAAGDPNGGDGGMV